MSPATLSPTTLPGRQSDRTLADLLHRLGDIPASRVLIDPPLGTATEKDVIAVHARDGRLCELVDGTLVEKTMGFDESRVAIELAIFLGEYLLPRPRSARGCGWHVASAAGLGSDPGRLIHLMGTHAVT